MEVEIKLFCTSRDHMINELVRATKLYKENIDVLQIGASFCYKLGQLFLLQVRANVVASWGSFFITNWDKCYYKLGQLLKIMATVITK